MFPSHLGFFLVSKSRLRASLRPVGLEITAKSSKVESIFICAFISGNLLNVVSASLSQPLQKPLRKKDTCTHKLPIKKKDIHQPAFWGNNVTTPLSMSILRVADPFLSSPQANAKAISLPPRAWTKGPRDPGRAPRWRGRASPESPRRSGTGLDLRFFQDCSGST